MAIAMKTTIMTRPKAPSGFCRASVAYLEILLAKDAPVRGARSSRKPLVPRAISSDTVILSGVPDAGVEPGVTHVYREIEHNDRDPGVQRHGLDHLEILLEERPEGVVAQSRQGEDLLHDEGAAEEARHLKAEDRDDGNKRVLEPVAEDDRSFPQPLCPCGAHVVLAQGFEQRRTR